MAAVEITVLCKSLECISCEQPGQGFPSPLARGECCKGQIKGQKPLLRSGTGLEMERKREKAGAAKETKITWSKAEQREKIWRSLHIR